MSTKLRDYQIALIEKLYAAWADGARNVMMQLHTGGGKTVILTHVIKNYDGYSLVTAHRNELVSQLSLALARERIYHDILAPKNVIRTIIQLQMLEIGQSFYKVGARCMTAGVDTLVKMSDPRFIKVGLYIADEGHHVLRKNKWGTIAAMFPHACGLFPTATPLRADGSGLGSHADGLADVLIEGPSMRWLIDQGHLTDYKIIGAESDVDLSSIKISASGDYSPPQLRAAVHRSHIVGDVVKHYLKFAKGKLGLTFAVSIESAIEIAQAYREADIPAEVITGKTPHLLRAQHMRRFKNREILQLVSVDVMGEGVDIPAIEVVSNARPTQSFALARQQFGRALRPMLGKTHAIVIDHVGNVFRHGLPDRPQQWSLDRRDRRGKGTADDVIPVRSCLNPMCAAVYERIHKCCPYCGHVVVPTQRTLPEHVDGDLTELSIDALAKLRGEVSRVDGIVSLPRQVDGIVQRAITNRHLERQQAQSELRKLIALWAGYYRERKCDDSEIYKRFYFKFGIDVLSAQSLGANEADKLYDNINTEIINLNITEKTKW
jgi:superfamily II DNA or RNA helicase